MGLSQIWISPYICWIHFQDSEREFWKTLVWITGAQVFVPLSRTQKVNLNRSCSLVQKLSKSVKISKSWRKFTAMFFLSRTVYVKSGLLVTTKAHFLVFICLTHCWCCLLNTVHLVQKIISEEIYLVDCIFHWVPTGCGKKSNPLPCFANSLATAYNFFMKLRSVIACSYLHYNF